MLSLGSRMWDLALKAASAQYQRPNRESFIPLATRTSSTMLIKGHSNVKQTERRIKYRSTSVKTGGDMSLERLEQLLVVWRAHGGELGHDDFVLALQTALTEEAEPGSMAATSMPSRDSLLVLFQKMDTNHDGMVDWDEFCTYMIAGLEDKLQIDNEQENPLLVCPMLLPGVHNALLVSIVFVPAPAKRIMTVAADGGVKFWNASMECKQYLKLDQLAFANSKSLHVTAGGFLAHAFRIVLATTARDIRFYHSVSGEYVRKVQMPHCVMCLDCWSDPRSTEVAMMAAGDYNGEVTVFSFSKCSEDLFNDPVHPQMNGEIPYAHVELVPRSAVSAESRVRMRRYRAHEADDRYALNQECLSVKLVPEAQVIVSSSLVSGSTAVIMSMKESLTTSNYNQRAFSVRGGSRCVAFSAMHNVLATAGNDAVVRVWNPFITTQPISMLSGHSSAVLHVHFIDTREQLISISDAEVIKIWDYRRQSCLNTLIGLIPHHIPPGAYVLSGVTMWNEATQSLVVGTYTELVVLQLERDSAYVARQPTHDSPVTALMYNPVFNCIVSGDEGGDIVSWDLSTGGKIIEMEQGHGGASITSFATKCSGYQLISGASDGSVHVWGMLSGLLLMKLVKKTQGQEVTGIFASAHSRVYSIGWDGELIFFPDNNSIDVTRAPPDLPQEGRIASANRNDMLTLATCGDRLMAVGRTDGAISIFNLRLFREIKRFDAKSHVQLRQKLKHSATSGADDDAPHSAAGAAALPKLATLPEQRAVTAMIWLKHRFNHLYERQENPCGVLVAASDCGTIFFWDAFKGHIVGGFNAMSGSRISAESINCMTSNEDDTLLITADSFGWVRIWDIKGHYDGSGFETDVTASRHSPRVMCEWRAHIQGISSMSTVDRSNPNASELGNRMVIVTSAYDCSVRVSCVHNLSVSYVGTFGAASEWALPISPSLAPVTVDIPDKLHKQEELLAKLREQAAREGKDRPASSTSSARARSAKARSRAELMDGKPPSPEAAPQESGWKKLPTMADVVMELLPSRQRRRSSAAAQVDRLTDQIVKDRRTEEEFAAVDEAVALKLADVTRHEVELPAIRARAFAKAKAVGRLSSTARPAAPAAEVDEDTRDRAEIMIGYVSNVVGKVHDRPSKLGRAFSAKKKDWHSSRLEWRGTCPRPNTAEIAGANEGMLVCSPYARLRIDGPGHLARTTEPPSLVEARQRQKELVDGRKPKGGGGGGGRLQVRRQPRASRSMVLPELEEVPVGPKSTSLPALL